MPRQILRQPFNIWGAALTIARHQLHLPLRAQRASRATVPFAFVNQKIRGHRGHSWGALPCFFLVRQKKTYLRCGALFKVNFRLRRINNNNNNRRLVTLRRIIL